MQFFNEFFSLLKSFRNQRNHSYLITLHRKSTKLKGLDSTFQLNMWTLDNVTSAHSMTIYGCKWTLMKNMGLPCKHLFKKRLQEEEKLFDKQFFKGKWPLRYYRTLSSRRFSQVPAPAEMISKVFCWLMIYLKEILKFSELKVKVNVRNKKIKLRKLTLIKRF